MVQGDGTTGYGVVNVPDRDRIAARGKRGYRPWRYRGTAQYRRKVVKAVLEAARTEVLHLEGDRAGSVTVTVQVPVGDYRGLERIARLYVDHRVNRTVAAIVHRDGMVAHGHIVEDVARLRGVAIDTIGIRRVARKYRNISRSVAVVGYTGRKHRFRWQGRYDDVGQVDGTAYVVRVAHAHRVGAVRKVREDRAARSGSGPRSAV